MKKLSYSLITLALAATAAQAQNAGPLPSAPGSAPGASDTTAPGAPGAPGGPSSGPQSSPDAAPPSDSDATAPAEAAPSTPDAGTPVASADVTDAEVQSYAQATAKVQKIVADTSLDDSAKQQQMAAAVTGAGLQPQRFNQISQAIASDEALRTRIQAAMSGQAGSSQS